MTAQQLDAVLEEVAKIDDEEFAAYPGGWRGEISTALLDAVFSIRAKYQAKDPAKGVVGRIRAFRGEHPEVQDDLNALVDLGEAEIRRIMGNGNTGGRPKSEAVVEAAQALLALEPSIATAADLLDAQPESVTSAYVSVHGLGWVTCEYFQMLLGKPGVKADTMIVRFVNAALKNAGLEAVDEKTAHELVEEAHASSQRAVDLTHFEHAIWRTKGSLVIEDDPTA